MCIFGNFGQCREEIALKSPSSAENGQNQQENLFEISQKCLSANEMIENA